MHVKGEERITSQPVSRAAIDDVHTRLRRMLSRSWGSHRFNSHGYVKSDYRLHMEPRELGRYFPGWVFLVTRKDGLTTIRYRTSGSAGWHPGL